MMWIQIKKWSLISFLIVLYDITHLLKFKKKIFIKILDKSEIFSFYVQI